MKHKHNPSMRFSILASALLLALASATAETPTTPINQNLPALLSPKDYSFGFFPQGWRREKVDESTKDLLRFETGYYGFEIDADDIQHPRFGLIDDGMGALKALAAGAARSDSLAPAKLSIEIEKDGKTYRAVRCLAGTRTDAKRMGDIRLWESGSFAQHYELHKVEFTDDQGTLLGGSANLRLIGWPDSLAFTAEITPAPLYNEGPVIGATEAGRLLGNEGLVIPHSEEIDPAHFTLEGWIKLPEQWAFPLQKAWLACKNQHLGKDGFFGLYLDKDAPSAVLNVGGGSQNRVNLKSRLSLTKGEWSHLALTYDGKTMVFYVNGKPAGSAEINRERTPGKGKLFIGRDVNPAVGDRLLLDDVRLWNRALAPKDISLRYAKPNVIRNTDGLVFEETFGSEVPPAEIWTDAKVSLAFEGGGRDWKDSQTIAGNWPEGQMKPFTLVCDFAAKRLPTDDVAIRMVNHNFPVAYDAAYNAQVASIKALKRRKPSDDPGMRDYDDFLIEVENKGSKPGTVPFVLDVKNPSGITGIHPTLCFEDGRPTGVHVQIGKNWHCKPHYFRGFTLLPAPVGTTRYLLRLSYGFYGTLPKASHSQLSLLGWGGNARWDQIAIGAWGETICFDMDHSLARGFVTDNRGMLVRNGADGPLWQWVDAGWGGDWLTVRNAAGEKLDPVAMKTLYVAHGPCLSEVEYSGQFGHGGEVDLRSTVRVPRTDDYVRTFFKNTYDFHAALPTAGSWLFKVGDSPHFNTPRVCYGNRDGLLGEQLPQAGAKKGDTPVDRLELSGKGPWWIAFPESKISLSKDREKFGSTAKALVISSYKATYGGKTVTRPSISLVVNNVQSDGRMDYSLLVTPPAGLEEYKPGDKVEIETEWITVPHNAEEYTGPNEALRAHLAESPGSWKTIHREALGNDLVVKATGGSVTSTYPVIVEVKAPEVTLEIQGGVGYVPVRFDGLKSVEGYKLYEIVNGEPVELNQAAKGNDFWQTDHDSVTGTYRITYNIPLDGKPSSRWVFKKAD
jgi:hypothetical protein